MFKANTGSSINSNPKMGGKEAALKAKEGLDSVKLAYVYASNDYELVALLEGVKEELPDVPLIGNTSFSGVITPEGYIHGDEGFVGVMAVSDPDMEARWKQARRLHGLRWRKRERQKRRIIIT